MHPSGTEGGWGPGAIGHRWLLATILTEAALRARRAKAARNIRAVRAAGGARRGGTATCCEQRCPDEGGSDDDDGQHLHGSVGGCVGMFAALGKPIDRNNEEVVEG